MEESIFTGSYAEKFDKWCDSYDPDQKELETVLTFWSPIDKIVLEVGCGSGRFTFQIAPLVKKCIAIDINKEMVEYCMRKKLCKGDLKNKLVFNVANAEALPFSDACFDAVFDTWTFSCVKKKSETARGYYRVLKKGGSLIGIEANEGSEYQDILIKFLPPEATYSLEEELEKPLIKLFGEPIKKVDLHIPYIFSNTKEAYYTILFDLEEWNKVTLNKQMKKELMSMITKFETGRGVQIKESVRFYLFRKSL